MRLFMLYYVVIQLVTSIQGANILVIQLVPFSSYINVMNAIVNTLAPHHQITFYSVVHKKIDHPNITFHPIVRPYLHIISRDNIFSQLAENKRFQIVKNTLLGSTNEYIEDLLVLNKNLQELIDSKKTFDLFFTFTHISEHLIPFAHIVQAPLVLVSAGTAVPWHNKAIGNPNFFSYEYSITTDECSDAFHGRIMNYLKQFTLTFLYNWFYIPRIDKSCQKVFPKGTPHLEKLTNNASLLLVNTNDAMGYSRPSTINSIQIGGLHCKPAQKLIKEFEDFIDGAGEHGIIYFSLGTTIQAKVPKEVTDALLKAFSKLPQRILWKCNEDIENLPENIKISNWFPQQDVLGHKKVKLFISHGGMLSLQEGLYHGVPILVIPITFDQPTNAQLVQKLGYGKYIKFNELTEERFSNEIKELLTNKQFREKAKSLSALMKDQPLSAANTLKWWTDYIIRHKGFPIYRPDDNRFDWYKVIETDIILFFITVIILNIITIRFLIKFSIKTVRYYKNNNSKKKKS